MSKIESIVREILKENADINIPIEQIGINDNLLNLGLDSISGIKVIVAIESEFNFEFKDDDLLPETFGSLGSLITYIENRMSEET